MLTDPHTVSLLEECLLPDLELEALLTALRRLLLMQRRPADLLELGCLDRRFELIEAVGVLHHLRDP